MLEKNIGPLSEAMHTYVTHGERFSMDKSSKSLMRNTVVELLKAIKGVHLSVVLVFPVWMS